MPVIQHDDLPVTMRGLHKNITRRDVLPEPADSQQMSLWEITVPPRAGAPLHQHPTEEAIVLVRGRVRVQIGDAILDAEAPATLVFPPETPHQFMVTGAEDAYMLVFFPTATPVDEYLWKDGQPGVPREE